MVVLAMLSRRAARRRTAAPERRSPAALGALCAHCAGFLAIIVGAFVGAAPAASQGSAPFTGEELGIQGPNGCDPGERRLRLAHGAPANGHPIGEAAAHLALIANRELDGRVCVEVFADGAIGDNDTLLQDLRAGRAEMAAPHVSAFTRFSRAFEVFDLPHLFEHPQSAEWFQNSGPGQRLLREMNGTGFKALSFWNAGMRHVAATRPILAPGDGKGLRVRILKDKVLPAMVKASGGVPVAAPEKRLIAMLKAGEIDALGSSWAMIYKREYYKYLKELTDSGHNIVAYLLVISDAAWSDLPLRDRLDLKRLVVRETAQANADSRRIAAESRAKLLRAGVSIRKPTAAQRAAWRAISQKAWMRFGPEIGQDYVDAAIAAKR